MEGEIITTLLELEFYCHLAYFGNDGEACAGNFPWLQNCVHLSVFFRRYAFWFGLLCLYYLMADKYMKIQVWAVKYYFLILFTNKSLVSEIGSKYDF